MLIKMKTKMMCYDVRTSLEVKLLSELLGLSQLGYDCGINVVYGISMIVVWF